MELRAKILTVSDSVIGGTRHDEAGERLAARLSDAGYSVVERSTVADGTDSVANALKALAQGFSGLIVTTGGTGFSPRDLTPEGTLRVIDREAPGLSEAMRLVNPLGRLSRARAGTLGRSIVINTPGSPKGAIECLNAVLDVLSHALELLAGESTSHPPETGGTTATSS